MLSDIERDAGRNVDTIGHVVTSTNPTAGASAWTSSLIDGNPCTDGTVCTIEQIVVSDGSGIRTLGTSAQPGSGPRLVGLTLTNDVLSWSHTSAPPTATLVP